MTEKNSQLINFETSYLAKIVLMNERKGWISKDITKLKKVQASEKTLF